MRPEILFPLFRDIESLKGVGSRYAEHLRRLVGGRCKDLIYHAPAQVVDRRHSPKLKDIQNGEIATVTVEILKHKSAKLRHLPYKVIATDGTADVTIVFFHSKGDYVEKSLPIGQKRVISGKFEIYDNVLQITHPDYIVSEDQLHSVAKIDPVYPQTAGLPAKVLRRAIEQSIALAPALPEWLDIELKNRNKWLSWKDALQDLHNPKSAGDLQPTHPIRMRLAYDELLANQLAIALVHKGNKRPKGRELKSTGMLVEKMTTALPYQLTNSQQMALHEIFADMANSTRMLRLLQGDVGSGKTVVALLSMLRAVENGMQAALMVPTEILAQQHLETITNLLSALNMTPLLLSGRDKGKIKEEKLMKIKSGEVKIIIGTHALFQEGVVFHDLGLAIIDEQHRFGVHQRLMLSRKGNAVDVLVMTATPIPRTLCLTAYGHMDVSQLREKPPGRKPIKTVAVDLDRSGEVIEGLQRSITNGQQIYWVCPLVDESEKIDLAAAEERYAMLKTIFGDAVGLVHGKMKSADKDQVMQDFADNKIKILVATTVIEVGVNVPNATIMVIEHAERFGLSQLHQLRGRVGRADQSSSCVLLYKDPMGQTAKARINIMRETEDGFRIAEEDLKLRGAGEVLGTRQSGLPEFKIADLEIHQDLLKMANDDAKLILNKDPQLESARGKALQILLYLFEKDQTAQYIRSG